MSKRPLTAEEIIRACRYHMCFEYAFENCYYHAQTEADLLLISRARYLTEIEVKLSLSDWHADKKKFTNNGIKKGMEDIKHFYYAVPAELVTKKPDWIDPRFGIISIAPAISSYDRGYSAQIVKSADVLSKKRCNSRTIIRLFNGVYYKHSDLRLQDRNRRDAEFAKLNPCEAA